MEIYSIMAIVPVVLLAVFILLLVKRNILERGEGNVIRTTEAVPTIVVLLVAILLIGGMTTSISPYSWDEDDGELTIRESVSGDSNEWDSYASQVKSLVIEGRTTTVEGSAFSGCTALEYVSVSDRVTSIDPSCFGTSFIDPYGQALSSIGPGEYVLTGSSLCECDPSIYAYSGTAITGLTSQAASATHLVIPAERNGARLTEIGTQAFMETSIEHVSAVPDCMIEEIKPQAFKSCASLVSATLPSHLKTVGFDMFTSCGALVSMDFPDTVTSIGAGAFNGCTSLESVHLPDIETIGGYFFFYCPKLVEVNIPDTVKTIAGAAFRGCLILPEVSLPASVESIASNAFYADSGITKVTFAQGFSAELDASWAPAWTFYAADGTTELDKTVASNLAGHTFTGTASALVMQS